MHRSATDADALSLLETAIVQALLPWPAGRSATPSEAAAISSPDTHDGYFRIGRSATDAPAGYIGAIGRALALFVQEVRGTDELPDYVPIGEALIGLWALAWPQRPAARFAARLGPTVANGAPLLHRCIDPLRRWIVGHQIFAVLTQGMVWSLDHLAPALAAGDDEGAEQVLLALAALYRASAAAFRFTAEFDPLIYAETLRPTMCEPYMPKGFSGTLSSDHGVLVARLTALREPLARAQQRWPSAYAQMRAALGAVYDNHRWVCERFDGANVPSLRTSSASGETSAVEMLDRFRARRLEMLR